MSWLGKVFGGAFGFMMGGPLGAILGATVGHQMDKGIDNIDDSEAAGFQPGDQHRVQMVFFTATFSVMGHVAKIDGRVSKEEIDLAKAVMANMELPTNMRDAAMRLFNEGKSTSFPLDDALDQLRVECHRRSTLIRMFIEIQLQAAFADGAFDSSEERLLLHICDRLKFSRAEYQHLKATLRAQQSFSGSSSYGRGKRRSAPVTKPNINDAYKVLGIKSSASDAEVKRAYRRLISQHHPDKLVAKGLPEEMMKIANEKTQQIGKAYELIRQARK